MLTLGLDWTSPRLAHVLCLGAHCDDIEIGCGGTIAKLADEHPGLTVSWIVFTSNEERAREARKSAETVLENVKTKEVTIKTLRDGFLPYHGEAVKEMFEELKKRVAPDIVFTHYRSDLHQDHRLISDLTWNTFRDHLVLEYEIPKFDGDLGSPNVFVHLDAGLRQRKIDNILSSFQSQRDKRWFTEDTFLALMRLRGMESNAPDGYAEAFYCRKLVLG
ncbi:MAG TPA: PIG-L deacetylase family protein [Methylomirabilota bacterium]|nr:PIG-L deacetylase family protein [Methylomirabilota bacterium]